MIETDEPTRVLAELTGAAVAEGRELEALEVRRPSLEDVYLDLVDGDAARGRRVRLFRHELRTQQLLFWRSTESAFFIFVFPPMLFLLLGAVYDGRIGGVPSGRALLVGLVGYGCANTAFAGLAITARDPARGRGPEAAPRDAAAASDLPRRRPRLDADRLRAPDARDDDARGRPLRRDRPAELARPRLRGAARRRGLRRARARRPRR